MPVSFRVKNSLAGATGRPDVAAFLQATNVVVGWHLSPASTVPTASTSSPSTSISSSSSLAVPIRQEDRLAKLVADAAASRAPAPIRQPPQRTLAALIKASLDLSSKFPVAPLAGFFHGKRLSLSHLARWGELDDATVYAELVRQLGAAPAGLVAQLSFGDGGISALLDAQSGPLLAALAARQAESGAAGGAPAAAGGAA
ncbi:hypothetical protein HYH03_012531 [Edaphochlamys debaryana]|uniref:Uncharacterized protein n=1 Tax=Edaphochlamys debaryana TaxID=47281 RepID=A0A835XV53_9CHLO|nr:hypothetical protein HYH03_012531 [Edaphochlamys debaryana]|eukprot:KAG2488901.1 hypothetical protein HYH03_012531 [Edaphochlamys debaryana]